MHSLLSILDEMAAESSDKPLFEFPQTRWNEAEVLTYRSLAAQSASVSRLLRETTRAGDRALLLFPTGKSFWEAFFGCLANGVIAVPLAIPNFHRDQENLAKVCSDCRPSVLITDERTAELLKKRADQHPDLSRLPVLTPNQWQHEHADFSPVNLKAGTTAFLQYTSGSTARPKGVQITHGNLDANLAMIQQRMGIRESEDSGVTWLPHFHDMGLVGSYLETLFTKNTTTCLPPEDFVLRPERWLQLISGQRASICGGPDFAYRLCFERIRDEHLVDIDLSSWRVAYIGAERIRAETLSRFIERFSPFGFRRSSFFPCYGLGEATLMATGGPPDNGPVVCSVSARALMANRIDPPESTEDTVSLVASGQTFDGSAVAIVDSATGDILKDNQIGEIFLSGASVSPGYFNREDLNSQDFHQLKIGLHPQRFLKTGDLGFLSASNLYVTGRIKEMIIIRGKNIFPEDIEQRVCCAHPSLVAGGVAAFSIEGDGTELLVIVAELQRAAIKTGSFEEITDAIRSSSIEGFGVVPAHMLLLRPASILRTSSGKPKRLLMCECFLKGAIESLNQKRDNESSRKYE